MSLLGNRGRFSKNENYSGNSNENSMLSLIGKNPLGFLKIAKKENSEKKENLIDKLKETKIEVKETISSHERYNKLINADKEEFNDKYSNHRYQKQVKYKPSIKLIAVMIIVELISIFAIFTLGSVIRLSKMTQNIVFDVAKVKNTNIDEAILEVMKGYKTVAIFGVDSRTGSVDKGNNADVNIIVNLNKETGDVQLVSVYRDLYLSITDQNQYDKLNAAYRKGGPEAAVKALNKNFDLNIDSFFSFNWKAVADGIELLGGIDLEITKSEFKYMNAFIHETCIATGIDAKNPAGHYIKSAGMQHLDGVQAVAYGRLRLMDSDFQRVERQKKVISLCLEKAKTLDIPRLRLIAEAVLPQIAYEFDLNELFSLMRIITDINITESGGLPEISNVVGMEMGSSGECVVPLNLEKAVTKLHYMLFNDPDYTPSTVVRRLSNRIIELRKNYAEENKVKASIKQSEEESLAKESGNSTSNSSTKKPVVSSKSNASRSRETESSVDETTYVEEPEVDDVSNLPIASETTSNAPVPVAPGQSNRAPGANINQAVPMAPGNSNADYNVARYDYPGQIFESTTNQNNAPAPSSNYTGPSGSPTANTGNAVVVSGPPTGLE